MRLYRLTLLALLLLSLCADSYAALVDDAAYTTINTPTWSSVGYSTAISGRYMGFAPSKTITLKTIVVKLIKSGSPTDNVVIDVYASSGTGSAGTEVPTGAVLASSDPLAMSGITTISGGAEYTFTFSGSNAITLTGGSNYCFCVRRSGAVSSTDFVNAQQDTAGTYANHQSGRWGGGTTWNYDAANRDTYFRLQYDDVEPTPTPTPTPTPAPVTYYVDPSGSDSGDGKSTGAAWQTLAKVSATTLNPGDSVLLKKGGTWTDTNGLAISASGTKAQPITLGAYGSGASPVIIPASGDAALMISSSNYVTVQDLTLDATHATYYGIKLDGSSSCTLQRLEVKNLATTDPTGADSYAQIIHLNPTSNYNTVRSCVLHDNARGPAANEGHNHLIYIEGDGNLVEGCTLYNSVGYGIHIYSDGGGVNNNIARYNTIHDVAKSGIILSSGTGNQAYYNVIYSVTEHGIDLDYDAVNCSVYNNTIYNAGEYGLYAALSTGAVFRNNITYQCTLGGYSDAGSTGTVQDHNLFASSDPGFVSLAGSDFHLAAGAASAINQGASVGLTRDLAGTAVPQGSAPEIGAYEYLGAGTIITRFLRIFN